MNRGDGWPAPQDDCGVFGGERNEGEATNGGVEGGNACGAADGGKPPTSTIGGAVVDAELASVKLSGCCKDARCWAAICWDGR